MSDERAPNGWPRKLLDGFRAGERWALDEVYQRHAPAAARLLRMGFAFRSGADLRRFQGFSSPFDFEDALQETFRAVFEPHCRLAYDGLREFEPYLLAIARNVALKRFRDKERLFPSFDAAHAGGPNLDAQPFAVQEDASPEERTEQEELKSIVRSFLQTRSETERKLAHLRFVENLSQRDAAVRLGMGRQRVRTAEARLVRDFIRHLRGHGSGPKGVHTLAALVTMALTLGTGGLP